MPVYLLRHPDPSKGGVLCGVDFYGGVGTTSSLTDVKVLVDLCGCQPFLMIDGGQEKPIQIVGERMKAKLPNMVTPIEVGPVVFRAEVIEPKQTVEAGAVSAAPVPDSPKPPEPVKTEAPAAPPVPKKKQAKKKG